MVVALAVASRCEGRGDVERAVGMIRGSGRLELSRSWCLRKERYEGPRQGHPLELCSANSRALDCQANSMLSWPAIAISSFQKICPGGRGVEQVALKPAG